jgi:predicted short-subunit dehydrogenase-like oxidoreductase (DUF2520 family)
VIVLAVPDDEIATIAASLAIGLRCRYGFHVSGALPASAIEPLRASGASLASLHPARVFTGAAEETWRNALVAVEGDEEAAAEGDRILLGFGARSHRISPEAKPLYHAAATLAAGGTAALISLACRSWRAAGIPEEQARSALSGLAGEAAMAAASGLPFDQVFTGPVARRDLKTISAHAAALASHRDALEIYSLLARETIRRTPGRGREEEILRLLAGEALGEPRNS